MDSQLVGSLIALVAALPYVIEVLSQVALLARVMEALPDEVRASLPPHPRRARWAVFGSTRFFLALFRYALRNDAADGPALTRLKRSMRASALREGLFAVLLICVTTALWHEGWRPI
ncbi:MAG TPA: hypothetical protein VN962_22510 [Polyangia bacterium]|nr:hypothetical protein [Polyangia bacterium]